jgi:hypothetical protein
MKCYFALAAIILFTTACTDEIKKDIVTDPKKESSKASEQKDIVKTEGENQEIKLAEYKSGFLFKNPTLLVPAINMKLKNVSDNSLSWSVEVEVVFSDAYKNEEFEKTTEIVRVSGQEAWEGGCCKTILISAKRGYKCCAEKTNLKAKIYLNGEYMTTVDITKEEMKNWELE